LERFLILELLYHIPFPNKYSYVTQIKVYLFTASFVILYAQDNTIIAVN